ncbi:uncharacterized protein METZ01_LOCUS461992, partial [marine metagenome]
MFFWGKGLFPTKLILPNNTGITCGISTICVLSNNLPK